MIQKVMEKGEKEAPVKSIKIKFQKAGKKREKAMEKARKMHTTKH